MAADPVKEMTVETLKATHKYYAMFVDEWNFLQAAYDGIKALIRIEAISRHERESYKNYLRRIEQAYGFGYSKSIVDLLNFHLFKKPSQSILPDTLTKNKQWEQFVKDCNLMEDPFEDFLLEQSRYAGIQGHVGILVDKASVQNQTIADELKAGIYPYVSAYKAPAILDWEISRDASNRPYLSYLKLLDDDGRYRIWTPGEWQIWEIVSEGAVDLQIVTADGSKQASKTINAGQAAKLVDSGPNQLKEIPFVWLYNLKSRYQGVGVGDINDIAYIDASIIRNLSQGEEVIDYAAFPMMRKPMQEAGAGKDTDDDTGPAVVLEFDPENPESKPDWLPAVVAEPIGAIISWVGQKVAEIYRAANIGGMAATEIQTEAKSGVALRTEFQMLNSRLAAKSRELQKAERRIIYYWTKWQGMSEVFQEVQVDRPKNFDIENLAEDLANILTSRSIVISNLFRQYLSKMVARRMLPQLSEKEMSKIDKDIDRTILEDEEGGRFQDEEEGEVSPSPEPDDSEE